MTTNSSPVSSSDQTSHKRSHKHLNYIPWEPSKAAVSRTEQNAALRAIPVPPISTHLYRYQHGRKSPSAIVATAGRETAGSTNRVKPTATVEPFQASINVDEILYGSRPLSPSNQPSQDVSLTADQHELNVELERVQEENAGLKQQLQIQTEVNAELKKLLVASVGTDFQCRLERLLRDKSRSEIELQTLIAKINDLLEEVEKLTIQCDIHRSRSAASRVLIDELNMHRSVLNVQYNDCSNVIQRLFAERSQLAKELIHTHSSLSLLNDMVLNHTRKSLSMSPKFDLIQLASYLQTLAASLFSSLKARLPQQQTASNPRQLSIQLELTEIEACALEILQSHTSISSLSTASNSIEKNVSELEQLESMIHRLKSATRKKSHERFHSTTRYENLTFNCCRDCSGDIYVV